MIRRVADEVLLTAINRVRRGAWWSKSFTAALWIAALAALLLLTAVGIDYWLRPETLALRGLLLAGFVIAILASAFWLWRGLGPARQSLVDTAQQMERGNVDLVDGLASATSFAERGDIEGESHDLREWAIQRAVERLRSIPESQWKPPSTSIAQSLASRVLAIAMVALSVGGLFQSSLAPLGPQRLFAPWKPNPWPRKEQLRFADVPRWVTAGDQVAVEIVNGHGRSLPRDLVLERRAVGDSEIEIIPLASRGSDAAKGVVAAGNSDFEIRARGGDDQHMSWNKVEVVPRATIAAATILVHPPGYSRLPTEESGNVIESLRGAIIEFRANCNVPLSAATLVDEQRQPLDVDITLSQDGHSLAVEADAMRPWRLTRRAMVSLELTDRRGLRSIAEKFELRARDDLPPHVELRNPLPDTFATGQAAIPILGSWNDDFPDAVVTLAAAVVRSVNGRETKTDLAIQEPIRGPDEGMSLSGTIAGTVDLSTSSIRPGDIVEIAVSARDAAGQTSPPLARRIEIIDVSEWSRRWRDRLALLLARIEESRRTIRQVRTTLSEAEASVGVRSAWNRTLQGRLEEVPPTWSTVTSAWERPNDGYLELSRNAANAARENREERSPVGVVAQELATVLDRVHRGSIVPLSEDVADAIGLGSDAIEDPQATRIEKLRKRLEAAIAKIDSVLADLDVVLAKHEAEQEALQLRPALQALLAQLRDLEATWSGEALRLLKDGDENGTAKDRALDTLVKEKTRLARELWRRIVSRFEGLKIDDHEIDDDARLEHLAAARRAAIESPLDTWLSESLSLGSSGRATEAERRVAKATAVVAELLDRLAGSPGREFRQRQEAMERARQDLTALASAQSEIVKRLQALTRRAPGEGEAAAVAAEQKRVLGQLAKLEEGIQRNTMPHAATELDAAQARMNEAHAATNKSQFVPAWAAAQSARVRIEAAIDALANDELAAERQRVAQTIQFLTETVGQLFRQQSEVVKALETLPPNGKGAAPWAAKELELSRMAGQAAEQAQATPALAAGLNAARSDLAKAADLLAKASSLEVGGKSARRGLDRLQRLLDALAASDAPTNEDSDPASTAEQPRNDPAAKDKPTKLGPSRSEIAWLQSEQKSIHERTTELDAQRKRGDNESLWRDELAELTSQQETLFKIVERWLSPAGVAKEKTPKPAPSPAGSDPFGNLDNQLFPQSPSKKDTK